MPRPHRSQRDSGSGGQPVNSELLEDGPAGYGITGDELLMAVARDPVSGEANNAPGEEQVYGVAAELVVEWRQAWEERKSSRHTLAWLRAERRRLELELRLIGVFGQTPPRPTRPGANDGANRSWTGGDGRCDGCVGNCP